MSSATQTVACPTCGAPATITMHTEPDRDGERFRFAMTCPGGHRAEDDRAQQLWVGAKS